MQEPQGDPLFPPDVVPAYGLTQFTGLCVAPRATVCRQTSSA
jgi:hypothetical protein